MLSAHELQCVTGVAWFDVAPPARSRSAQRAWVERFAMARGGASGMALLGTVDGNDVK